jgi:hypothetical protein
MKRGIRVEGGVGVDFEEDTLESRARVWIRGRRAVVGTVDRLDVPIPVELRAQQHPTASRRVVNSKLSAKNGVGSVHDDALLSIQFRRIDSWTLRISLAANGLEVQARVGPWTRMSMMPALNAIPRREPTWK